ncbi:MAG: RNA polymerase factor sigma-54 [Candidatus Omnitrophota bacterium]|nr:MAG: RNA polymerase factor sigma-54 [Candidatus Omnitrophota bacterium]
MDIKQRQKLSQRLALTPELKQFIHILSLPLLELKGYLETQIEENPVLEYKKPAKDLETPLSEKQTKELFGSGEENIENIGRYNQEPSQLKKKYEYRETLITKQETLHEHLLRQLKFHHLKGKNYAIGEFIIIHTDENGYLTVSADEIVTALNKQLLPEAQKITKKDIEKTLTLIHTFDPIGVGARNLKECLLIQLRAKKMHNSLAFIVVEHHLSALAQKKIAPLSKKLKEPVEAIQRALKIISSLDPKPGRAFSQEAKTCIAAQPAEIIVEKVADKYEVIINNRPLPHLKISSRYKKLMQAPKVSKETKKYILQKLKSALWLRKILLQREETIRKIAHCILKIQKEFLLDGDVAHLKPLTLKEVARLIGRNESTVSRIVRNKYIQTPYGIFKLDYFFSPHLKTIQGEKVSTANIKSLIFNFISEESHVRPLKDSQIVAALKKEGIRIARRTVAKYREELKIPPYHTRKSKYQSKTT